MNRRKNNIPLYNWSVLLIGLLFFFSCNNQSEHPDHEKAESVNHDMHNMHNRINNQMRNNDTIDLSTISLPTNYSVISSQKTVKPVWSENNTRILANGYIAVDERRDNKISSRYSGRIEKLFVKYNFQYVNKGEKIMEIYSAELNTMQEELLFLLKSKSEDELVKKAEEKLKLMGISEPQLRYIETSGKSVYSVNVLSPYAGYVYFTYTNIPPIQMSAIQPSQTGGMGMPGNSQSNREMSLSLPQIREGSYVSKGQTLFKVNDLKEIYGIVLIDNNHSSDILAGTEIELISELDKENIIKSQISLLDPVIQNGQKFLSAITYLKNESGSLKINSLVTAKINSGKLKQLLIPNSSILSLGSENIVWVKTMQSDKGGSIFQARNITIGVPDGNMTEVTSGLTEKDEIALDSGYMIDRESLIRLK